MKVKILKDVYNISNRIKRIDRNYYVLFNTSTERYEIHNSSQIGSSYCLTIPFNELDERTLNYVYQTSSDNIDNILEKIENDNNIRESAIKTSAFSNACEMIEQNMEI